MEVQEELALKNKINRLIDRVMSLKQEISRRDAELEELNDGIGRLQEKIRQGRNFEGAKAPELDDRNESEIYSFLADFCLIAGLIMEDHAYIEYTYKTKYSADFYKVEQEKFEEYVCGHSRLDLRTFLNFCIDLSLVKSEANRRCLYNSAEIRVYYVSRVFVDAAAQAARKEAVAEDD